MAQPYAWPPEPHRSSVPGVERETFDVQFFGPARLSHALAQELEQEGAETTWTPPYETRDLASMAQGVAVALTAQGTAAAVGAAVRRFRDRYPGAKVDYTPRHKK